MLFSNFYEFDVGILKVELNLSLKTTAVFKNQRAIRIPLQLHERVQHLRDIFINFDLIVLVNTDSLTTGNSFFYPCNGTLKKGSHQKSYKMPVN